MDCGKGSGLWKDLGTKVLRTAREDPIIAKQRRADLRADFDEIETRTRDRYPNTPIDRRFEEH